MYVGAVGDDDLAEQLKEANKREGLDQVYQVKKGEKTGACAVIITGHSRYVNFIQSICSSLKHFQLSCNHFARC